MRGDKGRAPGALLSGRIVGSFGRRYRVELEDGTALDCVTRGKRGDLACGDRVGVAPAGPGQGVIETVAPRTSLLYRSERTRRKLIAANATQIVVVVAPVPTFYEDLVNRCLAAAEHEAMAALIALNKTDLPEAQAAMRALELYRGLGYRVVPLCAKRDVSPLLPHLAGQTSVLVGQSGMGKSTIINALVPQAAARVAEVSAALDSGRHTTTSTRLYRLDGGGCIIDSPGLQEFGLNHLDARALAYAFVEFRPYLGGCRFRDCRHLAEPGCALAAACAQGKISERRLASYRALAGERREP
ncbi:MAG TPA: ribosome small subunit-dependent GTPase A [Burkholderiales bacterium]|nr:ribosome small subunit-dependent GTPase A [Burkholderiales bacterium]